MVDLQRFCIFLLLLLAIMLPGCAQPSASTSPPASTATSATIEAVQAEPAPLLPDISPIGSRRPVIRCREWITLREGPSTGSKALLTIPLDHSVTYIGPAESGFAYVGYQGYSGYVLESYLGLARSPYRLRWIAIEPEARQAANLFLSNFTEIDLTGCFDPPQAPAEALIGFATAHIQMNQPDQIAYGAWPQGNVRVAAGCVDRVLASYLGVTFSGDADLSPYACEEGYYYWTANGEQKNGGFACITALAEAGDGRYMALFDVYGAGAAWDEQVYPYSATQAQQAYGPAQCQGMALFSAADITDRSGYRLLQCIIER